MAKMNTAIVIAAAIVAGIILINIANGAPSSDSPTAALATGANMVSQAQLQQTANLENFSPTAYKDGSANGVQLYSIGYGHQIQPGEQYLLTASISQAQAQQFMLNDMQPLVDTLNNSGDSFTQGQFDALCDFGYNAGSGALNQAISIFENQGAAGVATWLPTAYINWHPTPGGPAQVNQTNVKRRQLELSTWNAGTAIATANTTAAANSGDSLDTSGDNTDTGQYFNIAPDPTQILNQSS